jgi:hypothetical protein
LCFPDLVAEFAQFTQLTFYIGYRADDGRKARVTDGFNSVDMGHNTPLGYAMDEDPSCRIAILALSNFAHCTKDYNWNN